nr:immunoglobulin heavy chain junction region [Macaca mulatta]
CVRVGYGGGLDTW